MDRLRGKKPNILVVGDLMLDRYLWGSCERISPEAPVQVVDIQKENVVLGGAGNVINNLISLGANVGVGSVLGDDENGDFLQQRLKDRGVVVESLVRQKERKTSSKSRLMASHQQVIRYDKESKENIEEASEITLFKELENVLQKYDALLLSDYGKGVLTTTLTKKLISKANEKNIRVLVDPKGKDYSKYSGATLMTPNKKEASIATGIDIVDDDSLYKAGMWLKNEINLDIAMITLSEDGMAIFEDEVTKVPTVAREVYDVTGAGDTVLASLGFALSCGLNIKEAALFATSAAAVVVGKIGSATTTLDEVRRYEHSLTKGKAEDKIKSWVEIEEIAKSCENKTVVFTNGCFDILHAGHVKYLEYAKSFGDILIIGLNSDASVRELKGDTRPVNKAEDRAYLLAALESVDYVVEFGEDTPYELIKVIKPDILVKGGDYEGKKVVGSDVVKEVRLVEFLEGRSTTNIIKKVQKS